MRSTSRKHAPLRSEAGGPPPVPRLPASLWGALVVVSVGAFFVVSDVAAVNVALPRIAERLDGGPGIEWVITGYLLALSSAMPAAGWAADRFGKHRVLAVSLVLYAIATCCAALAPSRELLIVARVLQGASSGALAPVGQAYVFSAFPPSRRGFALGVWGMVATLAPAAGPLATGALVTSFGWRFAFGANVPVVLAVAVLTLKFVPDDRHRAPRRLDLVGLSLAAAAFTGVLLGVGSLGRGAGPASALPLVVGAVALASFVWRSRTCSFPLVDLGMLRSRTFASSTVVIWILTMTQIAQLTLVPLQLQVVRGMTPLNAAFTVLPAALVAALSMPVGGRISDRIGSRVPVAVGTAAIAAAMGMMATVERETSLVFVVGALVLHGAGFGLALTPNTTTAMNSLPLRMASQAAVFRGVNRQIAAAVGAAVSVAIVTFMRGDLLPPGRGDEQLRDMQTAYSGAFVPMALLAAFGVVYARRLPGREASRQLREAREAELVSGSDGVT